MKRKSGYIIVLIVMLFCSITAMYAQTGFFVPVKGKVFFSGNTSTIFSNVTNRGQLGVGRKAIVNFKGQQWENDPLAIITDESNNGNGISGQGGIVRFLIPDTTLPLLFNQQQVLIGGYNAAARTGPAFANLHIANRWGVKLSSASTKIRRQLDFTEGNLYANDNILVVGDGDPGIISGYNESRFVVTGTSATGGFLLREKIRQRNGLVVFPIGSADGIYTPAAIRLNSSTPDDFYARVFDSVKNDITTGLNLYPKTVNKTWQIGKLLRPDRDAVDIVLEHRFADEGRAFTLNRQNAYVSQYLGGAWDIGNPQSAPQAGNLTTGTSLTRSGTNTRNFRGSISTGSYFTKFTGVGDTSMHSDLLWFSAYRTDYQHVYVYWSTKPQTNNKYFVVQRRLSNETGFTNRDTVFSRDGVSLDNLIYSIDDPNSYSGISYYRLMIVDDNGKISYSTIVPVDGHPGGFGWVIWPNPSTGRFFVGIGRPAAVSYVLVWDIVGRLLSRELVNGRGIVEMVIHTPGTYVVGLVPADGSAIESKKIVISAH